MAFLFAPVAAVFLLKRTYRGEYSSGFERPDLLTVVLRLFGNSCQRTRSAFPIFLRYGLKQFPRMLSGERPLLGR